MKRLFIFVLLLVSLLSYSQTKRTITNVVAGTLPTLISEEEKYTIEELTITGELNGTDFRLLRDMAGNNYLGQKSDGKLKVLDISGARIVAGGEMYLDADGIKGDGFSTSRQEGFHFSIEEPDVLTEYLFAGCLFETLNLPDNIVEMREWCFFACKNLTSLIIPESVTAIKNFSFCVCQSLTDIRISKNVQSISSSAFERGTLKTISVDPNNTVYDSRYDCNAVIKTATNALIIGTRFTVIPNSVTSIEGGANISVPSVVIPYSIGYIGDYAFTGDVKTVVVERWNPCYISEKSFPNRNSSTLYVPEGSVESYAAADYWKDFGKIEESPFVYDGLAYDFKDNQEAEVKACFKVGEVSIPEYVWNQGEKYNVTSIGYQAFGSSSISSVFIPSSVVNIGDEAFMYCRDLTSMTISEGVKSIGRDAFRDCISLNSVTIPTSVTDFRGNPFCNCNILSSIVVKEGNAKFDSRGNCNAIIETETNTLISGCENSIIPDGVLYIGAEAFKGCEGLTSINIPDGVIGIDQDAFFWCSNLSSVSVPNSVKSIGDMAFYGCKKVTSINIPEGITKIGYSSFNYCEGLTTITIPSSVTSIANYGFANCKSLTVVYCYAENVPTTAKDIFSDSNQENVILHVPAASVPMYKKASQWNSFKDIIALDDSDKSALCCRGKVVQTGSTAILNAEDWTTGGEDSNSQEADMYVFVNKGNNLTKIAKLEIQENTLNAGSLKWSIGGDTYDLNNVATLEKNFSTDENGIAFVKFIAGKKATEGNFQAKLTITVGYESKSYMINAKPLGDLKVPLTFEAVDGTVTVEIMNYYCSSMPTIQYSIDGGPWTDFYLGNDDCHGSSVSNRLPAGKIVQLRGELEGGIGDRTDDYEINCLEDCYVYGNVNSIKKGEAFAEDYTVAEGWWGWLFHNNTHLKNHPTKDIVLPATTLKDACYRGLFKGCTGLTRAPKLPATTLAEFCYAGMFMGCTSLTEAPELPATKLEKGCYVKMFEGCTNLKYVKCLANDNIVAGDDANYGRYIYNSEENGTVTSWLKDAGTNVTGTKTFVVNESLIVTGDDPLTATVENWGERSVSGIPEGWALGNQKGETEPILVSSAKQVTYMSDKDLDFTGYPDLKAYVATGYDKTSGTIWLTRVKEVPANTGFLLMGEADTYEIPVKAGGLSSYYQNMFKGTLEATTIYTTYGNYTNYYLSNGKSGVGFYKVTKPEGLSIGANRAYLPLPTEIPVVGTAGSTETIKVSSAGQVPYYNTESLDFSSLEAQGVKAYTATGYDYNSGTIWLTRVKQVPAKTGILIMAPEGEYSVPTASVSSVYANMFRGTLEGTTIQTHEEIDGKDYINYYLSSGDAGVGFYRVTKEEGVKIGANRCYLPILNKDAAAGTRSTSSDVNQIAFEESDEVIGIPLFRGIGGDEDGTTSIKDLTPALSKGEGTWYTLQGQRVAKPGKGLYIKNGKKVVIK